MQTLKLTVRITNDVQSRLLALVFSLLCLPGCNSEMSSEDTILQQLQQAQTQLNFVLLVPDLPIEFAFKSVTVNSRGLRETGLVPPFINDNVVLLKYENQAQDTIDIIQYQQPPNMGVGVPTGAGVRQLEIDGETFPMRVNTIAGITIRQLYYQRGTLRIVVSTNVSPDVLTDEDIVTMIESLHPVTP